MNSQSDNDLEELYDKAPCGFFSALPDNTLVRSNSTFLDWIGYDRSELEGKIKWNELLTKGGQIYHHTHLYPIILISDFLEEINFDFKKKNGEKLPVLLNVKTIRDESNSIILFRFVVLQFKQRKSYEKEILLMKERAQAASKAKSEFLASTSHEIRTPLNAIIGFTELLVNTPLNETQAEYIRIVNLSANSLMFLLNDLLDFSKIEAGKLELCLESSDIRSVVEQVVDLVKYQISQKKLKLIVSLSPSLPRFLVVDPLRLKQILINLLGNALKFTHEGEIEIKVESIENSLNQKQVRVLFSVKDSGIGISELNRSKIFEAFSQEDSTTTRKYGGTGLGLTISNRLLALMDSQLELKSELGKGSEFYFYLKAEIGKQVQVPEANQLNLQSESQVLNFNRSVTILIVDDNDSNRFLLRKILSQILPNGIITEATNGIEAIKATEKEMPAIIFMDIQMPEMDGYEATRAIRKIEKGERTVIIALSAGTTDEEIEKCYAIGMNDYASKPVKVELFRKILTRWLNYISDKVS